MYFSLLSLEDRLHFFDDVTAILKSRWVEVDQGVAYIPSVNRHDFIQKITHRVFNELKILRRGPDGLVVHLAHKQVLRPRIPPT